MTKDSKSEYEDLVSMLGNSESEGARVNFLDQALACVMDKELEVSARQRAAKMFCGALELHDVPGYITDMRTIALTDTDDVVADEIADAVRRFDMTKVAARNINGRLKALRAVLEQLDEISGMDVGNADKLEHLDFDGIVRAAVEEVFNSSVPELDEINTFNEREKGKANKDFTVLGETDLDDDILDAIAKQTKRDGYNGGIVANVSNIDELADPEFIEQFAKHIVEAKRAEKALGMKLKVLIFDRSRGEAFEVDQAEMEKYAEEHDCANCEARGECPIEKIITAILPSLRDNDDNE